MTRHGDEDDWDDDTGDDSDDMPTVSCPYCRREILEDSPQCPYCHEYISEEDSPGPRQPSWILITALICLGTVLWLGILGR
jgi:hypothetical protein